MPEEMTPIALDAEEIGEVEDIGESDSEFDSESLYEDESEEPGEAVLMGFDDEVEEAEDEPSSMYGSESTMEILDDDEYEYELEYEDEDEYEDGEDPNTNLDDEYYLPGDVASQEVVDAYTEDEQDDLSDDDGPHYLPPPDESVKDEVTFNVPLTRSTEGAESSEPEEPVGDSQTFDFGFDVNEPAPTYELAVNPRASSILDEPDSDSDSLGILQLDELDVGDTMDLPGEPQDNGVVHAEEFVLDEVSSPPTTNGSYTNGESPALSWIDHEAAIEESVESYTTEDSFSGAAALPDLEYLFQGYVVFTEGRGVVYFGRRYGRRLLDVHSYEVSGDLSPAYQSFLNDKVSEGFVPRADLTRSMPKNTQVDEVDLEEMGRAFRTLATR